MTPSKMQNQKDQNLISQKTPHILAWEVRLDDGLSVVGFLTVA